MTYTSTRDNQAAVSAAEAITRGISLEGGLFVPSSIPALTMEEMQALAAEGAALHEELLAGIKKDSESFNGYMRALKLPKETEEEKKIRTAALQQGLKEATEAPLAIAESAAKIFPMAEAVVKRGNKGAVSDGLIAAMLARTAVVGALFNVKINLASIKDESYVSELGKKVEKLESDAIFCEKSILCLSKLSDTVYNR